MKGETIALLGLAAVGGYAALTLSGKAEEVAEKFAGMGVMGGGLPASFFDIFANLGAAFQSLPDMMAQAGETMTETTSNFFQTITEPFETIPTMFEGFTESAGALTETIVKAPAQIIGGIIKAPFQASFEAGAQYLGAPLLGLSLMGSELAAKFNLFGWFPPVQSAGIWTAERKSHIDKIITGEIPVLSPLPAPSQPVIYRRGGGYESAEARARRFAPVTITGAAGQDFLRQAFKPEYHKHFEMPSYIG